MSNNYLEGLVDKPAEKVLRREDIKSNSIIADMIFRDLKVFGNKKLNAQEVMDSITRITDEANSTHGGYGYVPEGTLSNIGALGATTSYFGNDVVMVEDRGDPVSEGLIFQHEEFHEKEDQNTTKLDIHPRFKSLEDDPKLAMELSNINTRNELDARYKEIESMNDMIDAGIKPSELATRIDNVEIAYELYGDSYSKVKEDYNETMVKKVLNFKEKK